MNAVRSDYLTWDDRCEACWDALGQWVCDGEKPLTQRVLASAEAVNALSGQSEVVAVTDNLALCVADPAEYGIRVREAVEKCAARLSLEWLQHMSERTYAEFKAAGPRRRAYSEYDDDTTCFVDWADVDVMEVVA